MNRFFLLSVLVGTAFAQEVNPDQRLEHATAALRAFLAPESIIPKELSGKAQCLVVVPHLMKGAFLFGGKYGRGFASCRKATGGWTAPAAIAIEGGSFAPQVGGSSTDLILAVMNLSGMNRMMGDKFTLGAEASIVAGPVGADAALNTETEIVSYSLSRGLFTGLSIEGAAIRPDAAENKKLYGRDLSNRDILSGNVTPPRGAKTFVALLTKRARKIK